jgi:hypothetical protein
MLTIEVSLLQSISNTLYQEKRIKPLSGKLFSFFVLEKCYNYTTVVRF